jgi:hypothetical protein
LYACPSIKGRKSIVAAAYFVVTTAIFMLKLRLRKLCLSHKP